MGSVTDIDYWGEFGPELSTVVPYAYHLAQAGRLGRVTTSVDMECLYYFAQQVDARYTRRDFIAPRRRRGELGLPNETEHTTRLDLTEWTAPPYRERYCNDTFRWDKPTLVITNKYNSEWNSDPRNFIGLGELQRILERLAGGYQIVYNRPLPANVASDNSDTRAFADHDLVARFDGVLTMQDLHAAHPEFTFNELQLRVYANCRHFISVQGGNAVLASYFGGVNVIKVHHGEELRRGDYLYFPIFAGTDVLPCTTTREFLLAVDTVFAAGEDRRARRLLERFVTLRYRARIAGWSVLYRLRRIAGREPEVATGSPRTPRAPQPT